MRKVGLMRKLDQADYRPQAKIVAMDGRVVWLRSLCFTAMAALAVLVPLTSHAQDLDGNTKYAAIVVDAQSGEVFYAHRADSARYPASLTKIMTLYMAFDALAQGTLKPTDQITISARAASQAPVKVYLKPGDTIDVDTAMRLIALYSANDLAVALSEKIGGGSEERFAAMMTVKAQELGMTSTHFVNANGLPDSRQLSSARDLAVLARAVMRDYPQYYSYFNLPSQEFRGRTYYNHNPLRGMEGVDGMKTGFTNAAGYNLVASGVKNGHRLIAVMLGGSNKTQRREHVTTLMNTGFDIIDRRNHGETILVAQNEFTKAFDAELRLPDSPQSYTLLARADGAKPLSDDELRDALDGSEEATAGVQAQQASATVRAPAVVQALTTTQPAGALAAAQNSGGMGPGAPDAATAALLTPSTPMAYQPAPVPAPKTVVPARTVTKVAVADDSKAADKKTDKKTDEKLTPKEKAAAAKKLADADDKKTKGKKKKNPDAVWSVQIGAFKDKSLATDWAKKMQSRFDDLGQGTSQVAKSDEGWYRTRVVALTKEQAQSTCKSMSAKHLDCMVIKPEA